MLCIKKKIISSAIWQEAKKDENQISTWFEFWLTLIYEINYIKKI